MCATLARQMVRFAAAASVIDRIDDFVRRLSEGWVRLPGATRLLTLAVVSLVLLFLRRPLQFIRPDVWLEDGLILIPDYSQYGAKAIFLPVYDYLTVVARIMNALAMQGPLDWYAATSTALAVVFDIVVVLCVASAPTVLRNRIACALMVLLVPIYAEVYALPLYTIWFASILPVLALLWSPDRQAWRGGVLRVVFIVIGGLSSPIAIMVAPFFVLRMLIARKRGELAIGAVALLTAAVQAWFVFPGNTRVKADSLAQLVSLTVQKFFGDYIVSPSTPAVALPLGIGLIGFLGYAAVVALRSSTSEEARLTVLLYPLLAASILSSVMRWPIDVIDPTAAAPRYFFFPYVFLSWILVNLPSGRVVIRRAGAVVVALAVLNASSHFVGLQDPTDWPEAAKAHRLDGTSPLPVQMSGIASDVIYVSTDSDGKWRVEVPVSADLDRLAIPHRTLPGTPGK